MGKCKQNGFPAARIGKPEGPKTNQVTSLDIYAPQLGQQHRPINYDRKH